MSKSKTSTSTSGASQTNGNGSHANKQWDAQAGFAEFAGMGRENLEALVRASTIATQGYSSIAQHWADFTKATLDQGVETARAVFGTKNVKDAMELQSRFARSTFDRYVNEATRISELGVKTTTEALEPIQKRVDEVVAKYSRAA